MKKQVLVITCEHGGNKIPKAYTSLFDKHQELLNSHRGWDIGALKVYQSLLGLEPVFNAYSETSRLLVELNRSVHHTNLFSIVTKPLSKTAKQEILSEHYFPYRNRVKEELKQLIETKKQVVHISVHSFIPELNGEIRNADIGLLYDSRLKHESAFAAQFKNEILKVSNYRVRMNYPYLGKADGFTTYLRKKLGINYIGIELELKNDLLANDNELNNTLKNALKKCVQS